MDDRDFEMVARQVSTLMQRMDEVEKVNARLEAGALTTARALQEISRHWDAVYEAMRRERDEDLAIEDLRLEQYGAREDA